MTDTNEITPADTAVIEGRKVTVHVTRKIGLPGYSSAEYGTFITDTLDADADDAQVADRVTELFDTAKAVVYDAAGIVALVDDSGRLREANTPADTVKQAADRVGTAFPGTTPVAAATMVRILNEDEHPGVKLPDAVAENCAKYGITAVRARSGKNGYFFVEAVPKGEAQKGPWFGKGEYSDRPGIIPGF